MRKFMGCITITIFALLMGPGLAQDTVGNRLAAAEKYAQVFDFPQIMEEAISSIAQNFPENRRREFIRYMRKSIDLQSLRNLAVISMVQVFTADELEALASFYVSPVGRSILKKFPEYMGAFMPAINEMILRKAREAQE